MAQHAEAKDERALQRWTLKNFLAVNTTSSRVAVPDQCFYDLQNLQPIGPSNLHSVSATSGLLHDYAADIIYYDQDANVGNVEYLIAAATNGKVFAFNIGTGVATLIANAGTLSGSGTQIVQWKNSEVLIIDANGYFGWNGAGLITSLGGVTGAPSSGQAIAVYAGRVWIAQGRVLFFSAADTFSDFTGASGGGLRALTDSTLRSTVQALFTANGYLYVFGKTSVDAVSDVFVPTGATVPTFTYLNVDALIGTDQPYSIMAYGRLILFANRYGVYSLYGTSVTAISGKDPNNTYNSSIDGTWQYVDFSQTVSAGQFVSNNLLCAGFLIKRANDPIFGSNTVIAIYQGDAAGGKWWFGNLGALTRISFGFANNAPALFGYINNQLFQLFQNPASSPAASFMLGLMDFGDPVTGKQVLKAGIGIIFTKLGSATFTLNVDTTAGSTAMSNLVSGSVSWVNNANAIVTWTNNFSQPVTWLSGSFLTYWGAAPNAFAKYVGLSFQATAGAVYEINALMMDYKWAQSWAGN